MEPARLLAWKGYFISSTITGAAQSILKSELCTSNLCGKNKIPDYTISRWLYENYVQTPGQYMQTGNVYRKPEDELKMWHYSTIKRILENPVYIGNVIRHKSEQSFYAGKKASSVSEHEQIVIENNHKPIIDRQMYEAVQRILSQPKGKNRSYHVTGSLLFLRKIYFKENCFVARARQV